MKKAVHRNHTSLAAVFTVLAPRANLLQKCDHTAFTTIG